MGQILISEQSLTCDTENYSSKWIHLLSFGDFENRVINSEIIWLSLFEDFFFQIEPLEEGYFFVCMCATVLCTVWSDDDRSK